MIDKSFIRMYYCFVIIRLNDCEVDNMNFLETVITFSILILFVLLPDWSFEYEQEK